MAHWFCKVGVSSRKLFHKLLAQADELCVVNIWPRPLSVRDPNTRICSRNVTKAAVEEYLKHRYTNYNSCEKPCTEVDIQTTLVSKSESSKPRLMFMFGKTIDVSREVLAYTLFNLVAELGGYLGLTLGFSFLDINLPLGLIWQKLVDWKTRWIQNWWCCDTALRWTEQKNAC